MKFIFSFEQNVFQNYVSYDKENESFLKSEIAKSKTKIDEQFFNKQWDKYKKISNEFELIYTNDTETPSISEVHPVSRSYFKLWEILTDFEYIIKTKQKKNIKCGFIAEAPGGFVQAMIDYRCKNSSDKYYGMSLMSKYNDSKVPTWRVPSTTNFEICTGVDGSGSLYNVKNQNYFANITGYNTCDIVTADGGFDYTKDYNKQESISLRLIICEIQTCFKLIKDGGTFVLKIFDFNLNKTRYLLNILFTAFDNMFIVKPSTSRPANSEKYVICTGFRYKNLNIVRKMLYECIMNTTNTSHTLHTTYTLPIEFEKKLVIANCLCMIEQLRNISVTLNYISDGVDDLNAKLKEQYNTGFQWCVKYGIPVAMKSKDYYNILYKN